MTATEEHPAPERPRPAPNPDSAPFWEYCRAGELRIQRCTDCGTFRHHPRPRCPNCQSDRSEWALCDGRGTVASYTICHRPVLPAFEPFVPYNVIVVQLTEGPFMVSNLVDSDQDPSVGMTVQVTFHKIDDELTLPQFRLVDHP